MANKRKVNLYVEVVPTFGLYVTDADAKKAQIRAALENDGWDIGQISGGEGWFSPNVFGFTIEANVFTNYSNEQIRQSAFNVLDRQTTIINYGVSNSTIKAFSNINVRIVTGDVSTINAADINNNDFLNNLALGLGVSAPVALVIGAVGIVVFLKVIK
jgi:hypothetical protein